MTEHTPRLAPLQPPYSPEAASMLAKWMPPGSEIEPLRLFRTLLVNGDVALGLGTAVHLYSINGSMQARADCG